MSSDLVVTIPFRPPPMLLHLTWYTGPMSMSQVR